MNSSLGARWFNLTLSTTSAVAVCKYIRENVAASELTKGCHFNAIVNNADFFCGHIYSDGGSTWWGTIQQRGGSISANNVYKYFSYGGADSVAPFSNNAPVIAKSLYTFTNFGGNSITIDVSKINSITVKVTGWTGVQSSYTDGNIAAYPYIAGSTITGNTTFTVNTSSINSINVTGGCTGGTWAYCQFYFEIIANN